MTERLPIASDHAGFQLKGKLVRHLESLGFEAADLGTGSEDATDYAPYAHPLAQDLSEADAHSIPDTWLATPFDGGRHARRVEKIERSEDAE